jgi:hypothetical protein
VASYAPGQPSDTANRLHALLSAPTLPAWALGVAWLVVLLAYLYQGMIPAFNADDIIQIQSPGNAQTFISQGRWGFYLVFRVLLDCNPAPLFATVVGSSLVFACGVLAARLLEFRLAAAAFVFIVVASVSTYYGDLFDFAATRLAFPLGNFLAVAGLCCFIRRHRAAGVGLMALAPGFYPAASELAAAILVAFALCQLMRRPGFSGMPAVLAAAAGLAASVVLYAVATKAVYWAFGRMLDDDRARLDPFAIVHRFAEIVQLIRVHSLPVLARRSERWLPVPLAYCVTALCAGFAAYSIVVAYRRSGCRAAAVAAALNLALLVTPFCLIFASGGSNTVFAPRALYAFSTIHGFWSAKLLDAAAPRAAHSLRLRIATVLAAAASGFVALGSAARISETAFDHYLASQSDLLATNRIISRIETVLAETPNAPAANAAIPIAVIYDRPTSAGPRGNIGTARQTPWSREWIFRLIDRRFHWVTGQRYQNAWQAAQSHAEWPAKDSVFVSDGAVVVVINK